MNRPRPRDSRTAPEAGSDPQSEDVERVTGVRADPDHPGLLTLEIDGVAVGTLPRSEIDAEEIVAGLPAADPRVVAALRSIDVRAARAIALDLLAGRAHASTEIARKLVRRGFEETIPAVVIDELVADGWLDDSGFAGARIAAWRRDGRSDAECRRRLESAGLDATSIETGFEIAASDPDHEPGTTSASPEVEAAITALHRLGGSVDAGDPGSIRRAATKLARRGFDLDTIRAALRECRIDDAPLEWDWTSEEES